jgi:hypothetical protein
MRSSQQRHRCAMPRACFGTAGWLVRCRREHRAFPLPPKAQPRSSKEPRPPVPFRGGVLRKGRPPRTSATPSDSTGFLILAARRRRRGTGEMSGHDKIVLETAQGARSSRYVDGLTKWAPQRSQFEPIFEQTGPADRCAGLNGAVSDKLRRRCTSPSNRTW